MVTLVRMSAWRSSSISHRDLVLIELPALAYPLADSPNRWGWRASNAPACAAGLARVWRFDVAAYGYWMTLVVADALKGWAGGTPVISCQIAPLSSVAKARLPVEPILNGAAVAI